MASVSTPSPTRLLFARCIAESDWRSEIVSYITFQLRPGNRLCFEGKRDGSEALMQIGGWRIVWRSFQSSSTASSTAATRIHFCGVTHATTRSLTAHSAPLHLAAIMGARSRGHSRGQSLKMESTLAATRPEWTAAQVRQTFLDYFVKQRQHIFGMALKMPGSAVN